MTERADRIVAAILDDESFLGAVDALRHGDADTAAALCRSLSLAMVAAGRTTEVLAPLTVAIVSAATAVAFGPHRQRTC